MPEMNYTELFHALPVPVIITDENGTIQLVNELGSFFWEEGDHKLAGTAFTMLIQPQGDEPVFSFPGFLESLRQQNEYLLIVKNGAGLYTRIRCNTHKSGNKNLYVFTIHFLPEDDTIANEFRKREKRQLTALQVIDIFFNYHNLDEALPKCLPVICSGWRFPELAVARISLLGGEVFVSENFRETEWMMQATVQSTMEPIGVLEVAYLAEVPSSEGSVFLAGEERLIVILSRIIGMFIAKWRAINAIKEKEEMIRKITSQVPGNTYMFEIEENGNTNILFINRGTDELNYTHDLEDLVRHSEKIREIFHEDDKVLFNDTMKKAYRTQAPISFQFRIVLDNTVRWRWMHAISEKNKNGKLIWYGATQDITPLVDYISSIEQILFDISHVIRSPISSMLGLSRMVMENQFGEAELRDILCKLYDTAGEMDRFIHELNNVYIEKRGNTPLNIDFSSLIDKRKDLFH